MRHEDVPEFDTQDAEPFAVTSVSLAGYPETLRFPRFEAPLGAAVREARLLTQAPWVRSLGKLEMTVQTEGWKFPAPPPELDRPPRTLAEKLEPRLAEPALPDKDRAEKKRIRTRPTSDMVLMKDRLLYLLQPPLDGLFQGKQLEVPFEPFPYQLEGIAFLMPRTSALLADEMGLGKTAQAILALRLMFHQGIIKSALIIAPKPLIHNWCRELTLWAPDLPHEVFPQEPDLRRSAWKVSNCPLKLINYEALTRDAEMAADPGIYFDVVVLDEAQRIKNKDAKTAQAVRSLHRGRSWALTGTPIENHADDLVNIFAFVDPGRRLSNSPADDSRSTGLPPAAFWARQLGHIAPGADNTILRPERRRRCTPAAKFDFASAVQTYADANNAEPGRSRHELRRVLPAGDRPRPLPVPDALRRRPRVAAPRAGPDRRGQDGDGHPRLALPPAGAPRRDAAAARLLPADARPRRAVRWRRHAVDREPQARRAGPRAHGRRRGGVVASADHGLAGSD